MKIKNLKADLTHYFKTYPENIECFVTSDGTVFHNENDAVTHANSAALPDRDISAYDREYVKGLKDEKPAEAETQSKEALPASNVTKNPPIEEEKPPTPAKGKGAKPAAKK